MNPGTCSLTALLAAAVLTVFSAQAKAQSDKPEQPREDPQMLERTARELKTEGRHDEARKLMQEAEELRAKTEQMRDEPGPGAPPEELRRQELNRNLDNLRGDLEHLRATGKMDEAAEVKQRLQETERALARLDRRPRVERRLGRDWRESGPPGERPGQPSQDMAEMQRRLQHLQAAIDNLHAAGMHEPAERLAQEKERLLDKLHAGPPPGWRSSRQPGRELEQLRAELRELRKAVQELRNRVAELSRERR